MVVRPRPHGRASADPLLTVRAIELRYEAAAVTSSSERSLELSVAAIETVLPYEAVAARSLDPLLTVRAIELR